MLIRYPGDGQHVEFLELTDQIAGRLMEAGGPVTRLVRRIVALHTPLDPDDRAVFTVGFARGRCPAATPPNA